MSYPNVDKYDETGLPPALTPGSYIIKIDDIKDTDKEGNILKDKDDCKFTNFVFTVDGHPNKLFEKFYFDLDGPYAEIRLGKFKQLLIALAANTEGGEMGDLLGKVCRANVKTREYQGKTYNNILAFEPKNADDGFGPKEDADLPY